MTTVFESPSTASRVEIGGTHVLIIAAGSYPAFSGGDPKLFLDDTVGMGQLSSPPISAVSLADWFLAGSEKSDTQGFFNPSAPLASVEMLLSPEQFYTLPNGTEVPIEPATRALISCKFREWRLRAASHPDNVCVFYFCGHGLTGFNHYILPSDFGVVSPDNPMSDALDISTTVKAMRQRAAGQQYFFIDACRQLSWSTLLPGAQPPALLPLDPDKPFRCFCRLILSSTLEGDAAYSNRGQVSWFTSALISALSGLVGSPLTGGESWAVTGDRLARTVDAILTNRVQGSVGGSSSQKRQIVNTDIIGRQAFQYLTRQPKHVVPPEPKFEEGGLSKPWLSLPGSATALPFEQQVEIVETVEARASQEASAPPKASDFSLSVHDYFDVVLPVMLRWKGEAATELNKRVRFRIMEMPEQYWTINLYPPEANVTFQGKERADLTIVITSARFQDILDGKFDPKQALADGELELNGDLSTLKAVGYLFSSGGASAPHV